MKKINKKAYNKLMKLSVTLFIIGAGLVISAYIEPPKTKGVKDNEN